MTYHTSVSIYYSAQRDFTPSNAVQRWHQECSSRAENKLLSFKQ